MQLKLSAVKVFSRLNVLKYHRPNEPAILRYNTMGLTKTTKDWKKLPQTECIFIKENVSDITIESKFLQWMACSRTGWQNVNTLMFEALLLMGWL